MSNSDTEVWESLIRWLEEKHPGFESSLSLRDIPGVERGLIASRELKKGDTLLHIPSTCMLNPLTLIQTNSLIPPHLFPQSNSRSASTLIPTTRLSKRPKTTIPRKLDTTQLLTLHLSLTKDPKERYQSYWKEYIDSLPRGFRPWHPLTWIIPPSPSSFSSQKDNAGKPQAKERERGREAEKEVEWKWYNDLYEIGLSEATKLKVQDVKYRFDKDYEILLDVLREEDPFKSQSLSEMISKEDILWAWLNVNTRSISIPLGLPAPSERNNHTLVPIMDFINHSSNESIITPRVKNLPTPSPSSTSRGAGRKSNGNGENTLPSPPLTSTSTSSSSSTSTGIGLRKAEQHLIPNKIDFRLICPDRGLKANEEVFFEYGGHSSSVLFAEYGFCEIPKLSIPGNQVNQSDDSRLNKTSENEKKMGVQGNGNDEEENPNKIKINKQDEKDKENESPILNIGWLGMKYGEVDLTPYINELWETQDEDDGEEKRQVLEDIGCWGGNTLHSQPSPPHPSHSLLMTLRLIHLSTSSPGAGAKLNNISKGLITYISPQDETSALITLEGICNKVAIRANKRLRKLNRVYEDFKIKLPSSQADHQKDQDGHADEEEEDERDEDEGVKQSEGSDGRSYEDIGVLKMLLSMCKEEKVICTEILKRLEKGDDFS